ncbi:hypothetical protein V8C42DRAFT_155895 [Trichoderma barbatum]
MQQVPFRDRLFLFLFYFLTRSIFSFSISSYPTTPDFLSFASLSFFSLFKLDSTGLCPPRTRPSRLLPTLANDTHPQRIVDFSEALELEPSFVCASATSGLRTSRFDTLL